MILAYDFINFANLPNRSIYPFCYKAIIANIYFIQSLKSIYIKRKKWLGYDTP